MIWEEEGHHIFINLENKYKYTFSSSLAPHETLIWFCCFSSPKNSASKLCNIRGRPLGKSVGKESPNSSSITMHKFKSPFMDLPTSIYMLRRDRGEDKVVTTEGVSCITTQTNSKSVFLCFNVKRQIRNYEGGQPANDPRVSTRATREYIHSRLVKHKSRE